LRNSKIMENLDVFAPTPLLAAALAAPAPVARRPMQQPPRKRSFDQLGASQSEAQGAAAAADAASSSAAAATLPQPQSSDRAAAAAIPMPRAPEPVLLPAESLTMLAALRGVLRDSKLSEEARCSRAALGLQLLLSLADEDAMRAACMVLDAPSLSDEALLCACQAASQPDVSGRSAAAFVRVALLPRLQALDQPASRTLFAALLCMMKQHARVLLDELVVPAMWSRAGELTAAQAEALQRLVREAPAPLLGRALAAFLRGEGGEPTRWTEPQAALLQTLLSRAPPLEPGCVAELLLQADAYVEALRKSLKFANLLNTLVRSHGAQLLAHIPAVRRVAERLDSFMKKTILAAIAKLDTTSTT